VPFLSERQREHVANGEDTAHKNEGSVKVWLTMQFIDSWAMSTDERMMVKKRKKNRPSRVASELSCCNYLC
jgi:hypothetical protein